MAGEIANLDAMINLLTGGSSGTPDHRFWHKHDYINGTSTPTFVTGALHSLWRYSGFPSEAAAPGSSWLNPDNTTTGGLKQADPGGSRTKWLIGGSVGNFRQGTFLLYDRLGHISGLSGTTTTAQTFTGTLTRYNTNAGCVGNWVCAEIYTQIGSSGGSCTVSYTNQAGTSGQISNAENFGISGYREANLLLPFSLAAGDTGVQAVANADLDITTGTAGDFGITVIRPLALIGGGNVGAGGSQTPAQVNWLIAGGAQAIQVDACLALAWIGAAAAPRAMGHFSFIEAA
jgi:hypothetical protein